MDLCKSTLISKLLTILQLVVTFFLLYYLQHVVQERHWINVSASSFLT